MKLTTGARRRLAAGAALATAAILIPAAALAASAASGTPAHPAAVAVPSCHHASTEVWLAVPGVGSAGHIDYQLEFSNVGRFTCTLYGHPGVSAVNSRGHQVGLPASWAGVPRTVTLRPGATSHVILSVGDASNYCGTATVRGAYLRVYPPGQTVAQPVFLSVQVCPHRVTMGVGPVTAGAGIPNYTIR